jgi:UDP-GlcNAc:undecaprenyl-phosphate GlcNAc-1-phosphate transferase
VTQVTGFSGQSEIYLLGLIGGAGSFLLSWLLTPLSIKFAQKYGFLDYPNERKVHQEATPRVGGMAVVFAFLIGEVVFWRGNPPLGYGVLLTVLLFFLVMLLDDKYDLPAVIKFAAQIGAALAVVLMGVKIGVVTLWGGRYAVFPTWLSVGVSVLWLVLLSNAINLIDGLNGLSSGISAIVLVFASLITFSKGIFTVGLDALLLAGSVLGFLPFNFPEAKTFIGDCGAQTLGFVIGILSIVGTFKSTAGIMFIGFLLLLFLPVEDTLSAWFRRLAAGQHPFTADRKHLHHKLLEWGLTPTQVVLLMYCATIVLGIIAVLLMGWAT